MAQPEHLLQAAGFVYAKAVLPPEADFFSIRTETGRNDKWTGMKNKQAGVVAGTPDALLIYKGRALFIEYKWQSGVSDAQHKRHAELRRAGAEVFIVRSITTLRAVFEGAAIPLRFHALSAEARDEMLALRAAARKPAAPRKRTPRAVTKRGLALAMKANGL